MVSILVLVVLVVLQILCSNTINCETTTGTIDDVKHVVIFMQENRPFDHYFGTLGGVRGFNDRTSVYQ